MTNLKERFLTKERDVLTSLSALLMLRLFHGFGLLGFFSSSSPYWECLFENTLHTI